MSEPTPELLAAIAQLLDDIRLIEKSDMDLGAQAARLSVATFVQEREQAAVTRAAQILRDEVARHRADNPLHEFCEDYGCSNLEEFAERIAGLAELKEPE